MAATSKAAFVWAKATVVARTAKLHNVTVNLYMTILFDFRRKTTTIFVRRGFMKNLFDAETEEPGSPEGERQARIELACLDGVDGLPGHIEGVGQLRLRPVALGAQHLKPILHRYRRVPYRLDTANVRIMRSTRCEMSALKGIMWYAFITEYGMPATTATPTVIAREFS